MTAALARALPLILPAASKALGSSAKAQRFITMATAAGFGTDAILQFLEEQQPEGVKARAEGSRQRIQQGKASLAEQRAYGRGPGNFEKIAQGLNLVSQLAQAGGVAASGLAAANALMGGSQKAQGEGPQAGLQGAVPQQEAKAPQPEAKAPAAPQIDRGAQQSFRALSGVSTNVRTVLNNIRTGQIDAVQGRDALMKRLDPRIGLINPTKIKSLRNRLGKDLFTIVDEAVQFAAQAAGERQPEQAPQAVAPKTPPEQGGLLADMEIPEPSGVSMPDAQVQKMMQELGSIISSL